MHPVYTQHARAQMAEHQITEAEVEETLRQPRRRVTSRSTGNLIFFGQPQGRRIAVVVACGSRPPRVVTVWD